MYFKAEEDEGGAYQDENGTCFSLQQARRVRPANGWTRFDSLEECLAAWKIRRLRTDTDAD